jgi:hypothetical protein
LAVSLDMHKTREKNIQGGHGGMDKKAGRSHYGMLEKHLIANNVICDVKFGPDTFEALLQEHVVLDYQLTLSVFHWLPLSTRAHFERVLATHLRNARTTFLELPSPTQKPCANYLSYKRWYDGRRNMSLIIRQAVQRTGPKIRIKQLTPGYKSEHRIVFRVDNLDAPAPVSQPVNCAPLMGILGCRNDTPYAACPENRGAGATERGEG